MGIMNKEDYFKYEEVYNKMKNEISKPDLIILLRTDITSLLKRIEKRGREYEKDIQKGYLDIINNCYEEYINLMKNEKGVNTLIVETSELNHDLVEIDVKNRLEAINERLDTKLLQFT